MSEEIRIEEVATEEIVCHECGHSVPDDDVIKIDGKVYGSCCATYCECCDEPTLIDDLTAVYGRRNRPMQFCESCLDRETFTCNDCGETYYNDQVESFTIANRDTICEHCMDNYTRCQECGGIFGDDDLHYSDGDDCYYCSSCGKNNIIKEHSYKPNPEFKKMDGERFANQEFLGFELEIEGNGARKLSDLAESISDDFFYCKKDGSLSDGFEIVTHPFTRAWFYSNLKAGIFDKVFNLKSLGCKSYDTTTCGLHIHISKNRFTTIHLYKFMKLMYENGGMWKRVSRRKGDNFDRWCSANKSKEDLYTESKNKSNSDSRYTALNITSATVECRIFRGTLNKESFVGNIEILLAMIDFTRVTSIRNITFTNYRKFINEQKKYKYAEKLLEKIFGSYGEREEE